MASITMDSMKSDFAVEHVDRVSSQESDEDIHRVATQAKAIRVDGDGEDHMHEPPVSGISTASVWKQADCCNR